MTRKPFFLLSVILAAVLSWTPSAYPETEPDTSGSTGVRRAELARTRRVGYLERVAPGRSRFQLKDVWSRETFEITSVGGLRLEPYLGRYVSMHGKVVGQSAQLPEFRAEKIIDLDHRRRGRPPAVSRGVEQAAHFDEILPVQNIEIEMPSETLGPELMIESTPDPFIEALDVPPADEMSLRVVEPVTAMPGPLFNESFWIRGEYLWWWTDGLRLPPLITTSPNGTPRAEAGVLGVPGTQTLSPVAVNNDAQSGYRIRGGYWIDGASLFGVGGDFYTLNNQAAGFSATSTGNPIVARPFFDALNAQETAELVAFPNVIGGTVAVDARTEYQSGGLHGIINLSNADWSDASATNLRRIDLIVGYRYARLRDNVVITENLTSQDPMNTGSFRIHDSFDTVNEFHGGELGFQYHRRSGPWMVEALSKIALGNNHQVVSIDGSTRIIAAGVDTTLPGGLLAQRSNMGRHVRDEFAVLPEIGMTLGYRVTPRFTVTLGYTLVYLSNVLRAGDQIDLDVNPNLLPPETVPFAGPLRPEFAFQQTDFWAQGFSLGGDYRW